MKTAESERWMVGYVRLGLVGGWWVLRAHGTHAVHTVARASGPLAAPLARHPAAESKVAGLLRQV